MSSMNAGKGMAQAAHAANAFVRSMNESARKEPVEVSQNIIAFRAWESQTNQGFGTTITLAVPTETDMIQLVRVARSLGYAAGVTHDPSYPVRDGKVTHLIPVDTCAYIFSPDGSPWFLSTLPLHP